MRDNDLKARQKRRFKKTTDSNHGGWSRPIILIRILPPLHQIRNGAADISYIWTAEGWLYLAIVLVRGRLKKDLALSALLRALALRQPKTGMLHHSDRGSQYCSYDYQRILGRHGFILSMSGKGNCYDNAMVESELIWRTSFQSRQAENAIARYIDGFYNPVRRHSALG